MKLSESEIESKAEKLLKTSGVEGIYPVPLVPIAESLGYKLEQFTPTKPETAQISGMVEYAKASILVNSQEPAVRKRFTIAHEFGHIQLHGDRHNYIDYRSSIMNLDADGSVREAEADAFAAALLMPEKNFEKFYLNLKII